MTESPNPRMRAVLDVLQRELQAAIVAAIASRGVSVRDVVSLERRLNCTCVKGDGCVYTLDGRKILWAEEPRMTETPEGLKVSRRIVLAGKEGVAR